MLRRLSVLQLGGQLCDGRAINLGEALNVQGDRLVKKIPPVASTRGSF
jgi:hypothetical protein